MREQRNRDRRDDRRRAQRHPLDRRAYFVPGAQDVLPQHGQAVDVSRDGVLIRTARPAPEGTAVDIEMTPGRFEPGSDLILTRGRVARIVERGDGDYDMGVHLHVSTTHPVFTPKAGPLNTAYPNLGALMSSLRPSRSAMVSRGAKSSTKASSWTSWILPVALILIGLLLLLLWPWLLQDTPADADLQRYPAQPTQQTPAIQTQPATTQPDFETSRPDLDPGDAAERPQRPQNPRYPETTPPATELSWPEPRQSTVYDADYPKAEANRRDNREHSFQDSSRAAPPAAYGNHRGVLLDVEKDAHRMTLYVNGQKREQFTIGLGEDGSTPEGDFTIGTKLTDPDWFNRGEVVPAGDPDNLIGKRWLGLARNGALTPYGIHPTNDLNSLGGDQSRGCIRVKESDANTLFRLCPVGTKVVIR